MTSVQNPTFAVATIDVQEDGEIAISVGDAEVTLTKDKIGNLFQGTSKELETEWLQLNWQALQDEPSSL